MQETAKGFYKFTDDDEYDVSQFVNQNIDAAEALAFVDKVVPEFPTPTTALIGKRYKKQSTNEVKECGLDEHGQPAWLPIGGGQSTSGNAYKSLNVRQDYLADTEYEHDNIDYEYANQYFKTLDGVTHGRCSQARNGNYVGRNFDWTYDNEYEFFIRTNRNRGRHKSIGMCGSSTIMKADIERGGYNQKYKLLPFVTADGINENHVYIGMNVVPDDMGTTKQEVAGKDELCSIMIPRMVLDYANTAEHATQLIQNYNIYSIPHNEVHFMICDQNKTYIVEFINNVTKVTDATNFPWLTNFHIEGVEFDSDGKIDWSTVEDHGQGLERYDYIKANIGAADTRDTLLALMRNLDYSKAYSQPNPLGWKTEFTEDDITIHSTDEEFMSVITPARNIFEHRTREEGAYYGTWQTVHTSIYDIDNLTLSIVVQEESNLNLKTYSLEETKEGGGFEPVDVDPIITSRSELGKAIYNKTEDKYKVSQVLSENYYNWIFLPHTEGVEASRPALGYYKATDTGKWFLDNVEITDQVTEEKVEPSETTNGKLYFFDSNLCKGYKIPEKLGFNIIPTGHMGDNDFHYVVGIDNGKYSSTGTIDKLDVWYEGDNRDFVPMTKNGGTNATTKGTWLTTPLYDEYMNPCVIGHEDKEPKYYLNKDKYTEKRNAGGTSILTGADGDVMVKFKKMYIWFEKSNYELKNGILVPRTIKAHVSNRKLNDEYECTTGYIDQYGNYYEKDQVYMGVYTMSMFNNIIHSISGTATLVNKTRDEYVQYCKDKTNLLKAATGLTNEFYNLEHRKHINMLWVLETMFFRSKDLNTMVGSGRVKTSNTNAINNGTMNDLGFIWGDTTQTNGRKDCGLENMVGNIHRWQGMCGISNVVAGQHQIFDYTQCVDPEFYSQRSVGYEGHYEIPITVDSNYHDFYSKELCFKDLTAMDMEVNNDVGSLSTYMCKNHRWHFKYSGGTYDTDGYAIVGAGGHWNGAAIACLFYACSVPLAFASSGDAARLCRY